MFILSCPRKAALIESLWHSGLNPPTVLPCSFTLPNFLPDFLEVSQSAVNVRLLRDEAYLHRDTIKQTLCIDQFTPHCIPENGSVL